MKLLIAEDNRQAAEAIAHRLREPGFQVEVDEKSPFYPSVVTWLRA